MPDEVYCYADSDVLMNKLGIRDMEQLFNKCIRKIRRFTSYENQRSTESLQTTVIFITGAKERLCKPTKRKSGKDGGSPQEKRGAGRDL